MSSDLQWSIIRKNSCFLVKSLGTTLSKEPNNISGKNSFKANGLVNKKVVGVKAGDKGVVLTTRSRTKSSTYTLNKGGRRTIKSIKAVTNGSNFRADLSDAAIRKASALLRSQTAKVNTKRRSRKFKN